MCALCNMINSGDKTLLPAGFKLGHAGNIEAGTGCTVVLCESGALAGVSVRGAAPASIETDLLDPRKTVQAIHGVMLSGGSAFGLEAASGALQWLSERNVGFPVGAVKVPLVSGASIFDLNVGNAAVRPDKAMGYAACEVADETVETGSVGAGTGASVGKLLGDDCAMKGGFGAASLCFTGITVTALVVVNAVGNVTDRTCGKALAGVRDPSDPQRLMGADTALAMLLTRTPDGHEPREGGNTTIGCILTDAKLSKAQAAHIADMAHDGLARSIDPIHTGFDGDAIFTLSTGCVETEADFVGILATWVMEKAVYDAVLSAETLYGLPSARSIGEKTSSASS